MKAELSLVMEIQCFQTFYKVIKHGENMTYKNILYIIFNTSKFVKYTNNIPRFQFRCLFRINIVLYSSAVLTILDLNLIYITNKKKLRKKVIIKEKKDMMNIKNIPRKLLTLGNSILITTLCTFLVERKSLSSST